MDYHLLINWNFLGNSGQQYLTALGIVILSVLVLKFFKFVIVKKLKAIALRSETKVDDLIIKIFDDIGWPFYVLISAYLGLKMLSLSSFIKSSLGYVILVFVAYYVVKAAQDVIDFAIQNVIEKRQGKEGTDPVIHLLGTIGKIALWIIAVLFIVSNMGFNVTSLVAGLGIGGIAIALALQSILGDVFSSFSIYFDKPFQPGDFITVGEHMGTVKRVGIKSTRLESITGEELIIPNKELTAARVQNYKRLQKRRLIFKFGLTYDTPIKKLRKAKEIVKEIIEKTPLSEFDRVHFKEYGDSALMFEVSYYINTGDYNKYMDVREEVNLAIKEAFEKEGLEFAFPTQTIHLAKRL
jgi:small-conductance mechanosensitive channel